MFYVLWYYAALALSCAYLSKHDYGTAAFLAGFALIPLLLFIGFIAVYVGGTIRGAVPPQEKPEADDEDDGIEIPDDVTLA